MPAPRPLSASIVALALLGSLTVAGCRDEKDAADAEAKRRAAEVKAKLAEPTSPPLAPVAPAPTEAPTAEPEPEPTATAEPTATPAEAAAEEEEAGEGDASGLELLGVVKTGDSPTAAVIASGGEQEIFRRGDSVFDHGTVKSIGEDSVVLEQGKRQTTLRIATAAVAPPPPPEEAQLVEASRAATEPAPPPVTEAVPRAQARAAFQDFGSVLASADAERVPLGGGHAVKLGQVPADGFLARLGLRAGDVLQKVNGVAITDPKRVPDLSGGPERDEVSITFTRDGVGVTLARPLR